MGLLCPKLVLTSCALPIPLAPRYELGSALYLGWSASLLAILGGICLCSHCCCSKEDHVSR